MAVVLCEWSVSSPKVTLCWWPLLAKHNFGFAFRSLTTLFNFWYPCTSFILVSSEFFEVNRFIYSISFIDKDGKSDETKNFARSWWLISQLHMVSDGCCFVWMVSKLTQNNILLVTFNSEAYIWFHL